ncbi:hypothetical protein IGI53_003103 [Enterococcus sp. DIV0788_1]
MEARTRKMLTVALVLSIVALAIRILTIFI